MNKLKVYTAGGFHGDWRTRFKERCKDLFTIIDPLDKELNVKGERKDLSFEEYSAWDLWAIRTSDIVFVYAEKSNPGIGFVVEAGYAKGLGKTVILVRELENEHRPDRYQQFLDCVADYVCHSFEEGLQFLESCAI